MDRNRVREAWDDVSEQYAASRDPTGPEADLIDDLLAMLSADPRVLDVGCGDGARTLANLPESAVGIDISDEGLTLAQETVSQPLVQGDMVELPFDDNTFDGITAYFAVFHVSRDDHPAVYDEFARVLRDEGGLLMTLPSGQFETVRRGWMGGEMFFSAPGREATLQQLQNAGFTDIQTMTSNDPLGSSTEFVLARLEK